VGHLLVISINPGDANTLKQRYDKERDCCAVVIKYLKNIKTVASDHTESNKQHENNNDS
jgi:precorrin-3B methylase